MVENMQCTTTLYNISGNLKNHPYSNHVFNFDASIEIINELPYDMTVWNAE